MSKPLITVTIDNNDGSYKTLEDHEIKSHISQYSGYPAYELDIPDGAKSIEIWRNNKTTFIHFFVKDALIDKL